MEESTLKFTLEGGFVSIRLSTVKGHLAFFFYLARLTFSYKGYLGLITLRKTVCSFDLVLFAEPKFGFCKQKSSFHPNGPCCYVFALSKSKVFLP